MGRVKAMMQYYQDREFSSVPDKKVCINCFNDDGLKNYISEHGEKGICSYCARSERHSKTISLENIIEHIQQSLRLEYPTPEDSGTPYESREGGWLVEPIDVYDIFFEEPLEENHDEIREDVISALNENLYLKPFAGDVSDYMHQSWYYFKRFIQHKSRFLFYSGGDDYVGWKWEESRHILNTISKIISSNGMVKTIKQGEVFFRVRLSKCAKSGIDAKSLGTVPENKAIYENRMSPAGIPMFYGSQDLETAIKEAEIRDNIFYQAAEFIASRDINVIDFVTTIWSPSIYDEHKNRERHDTTFIRGFVNDVTKPIAKDEKHHIEYIPTQLIAEYLRYNFEHEGSKIDGIMYRSAANTGGISYALFVDNDHCINADERFSEDELCLVRLRSYTGLIKTIFGGP